MFAVTGVAFAARAAEANEISESAFLARLGEEHPAISVLGGELADAMGERRTPRTENPDFSFEREAPDGAPGQSTVKLSWRPPLDTRRGLANKVAEAGLAAAERRLEWERLQLREQLRELFARWSLAVQRRDLFADLTGRTLELAERARARAATGEDSGLSARRLALAAAESRSAMAGADAQLLRIDAELRTVFPDLESRIRPVRPSLPPAPSEITASDRPDLKAREVDVERADLARRLGGRYLEFPALIGGWTVFDEENAEVDGPVFGVEWTIPLFDRQQGERVRTSREANIARARLELMQAQAVAELSVAFEIYEQLRTAAVEVTETTVGAEAVIEAATAEFQAGEATLTDLLETLRSVTDSRLAALELYREALAAHRRLELCVGRPLTDGGS